MAAWNYVETGPAQPGAPGALQPEGPGEQDYVEFLPFQEASGNGPFRVDPVCVLRPVGHQHPRAEGLVGEDHRHHRGHDDHRDHLLGETDMADLKDVLRHLITHAEGYATPALRQEHLDVLEHLGGPPPAVSNETPVTKEGA